MIYYNPWGDKNTASSRLRVYNIAPYLDASFDLPDKYEKGDVLIIQKTPNYMEMRKAQSQGAKVIYDIDDWWDSDGFKKMTEEADLITVDTKYKLKLFPKAKVIPDSLDWSGLIKINYSKGKLMGWTSYGNNAHYLNKIVIPLKKQGFRLRLITTPNYLKYFAGVCEFVDWSLQSIDTKLAECDYGIYRLADNDFSQSKGMHKLLKNWAIGLPTYVSPTPDYIKAVREANVSKDCFVSDWSKLKPIKFDPKMREYALKYLPVNIAKIWKKEIKKI